MVKAWVNDVSATTKNQTLQSAHAKGVNVLLQLRVGDDPADYDKNSTLMGINAANYAKNNNFDGMDVYLWNFDVPDIEDNPQFVTWIANLHTAIRSVLGPDAIVTHSLQPWEFGLYGTKVVGYNAVHKQVGNTIGLHLKA